MQPHKEMSRKHKEGLEGAGYGVFPKSSRLSRAKVPGLVDLFLLRLGGGDAWCCARPNAFMEEAGFGPGRSNMHTGETLAAAPPARPLRQSRLGGLSLLLALAGVAIALAVMALALGERIDLSDENHLLGLFAALLAVFAVSTCGLVLGLAGLLRRSSQASPGPGRHRPQPVVPALGGWHALSTAAAAILVVLGQPGCRSSAPWRCCSA